MIFESALNLKFGAWAASLAVLVKDHMMPPEHCGYTNRVVSLEGYPG